MKRIILLFVLILIITAFTGCFNKSGNDPANDPTSENYDWNAAREVFIEEIDTVLGVIASGTQNEYLDMSAKWAVNVEPSAHSVMFARTPPEGSSSSVTYCGYSAPEHNSNGSEYVTFNVRRMNNETLAAVDWRVTLRLDRGSNGYYIGEYIQEVI